jgi:hypothetical protein
MRLFAAVLACCLLLSAQQTKPAAPAKQGADPAVTAKIDPAVPAAAPKTKSETLRFEVNWPSGLSLGEGELTSTFDGTKWSFGFKAEAAVPGFAVSETAESVATPNYCSLEFKKGSERGKRNTEEQTVFDSSTALATRKTLKISGVESDGKSELKIGSCPKDALTFLYFVRRELAAGRLPPAQPVYYGGPYQSRVEYTGTQSMRSGDKMVDADRLKATIKGATNEFTVDLFFARNPERTPLLVEVPVAMGKFSVEFVH